MQLYMDVPGLMANKSAGYSGLMPEQAVDFSMNSTTSPRLHSVLANSPTGFHWHIELDGHHHPSSIPDAAVVRVTVNRRASRRQR